MIDMLAKLRELEAAGWLRMKDPKVVSAALLGAIARVATRARERERAGVVDLLEHLVCVAASDPRRVVTQEYLAWLQGAWPGARTRVTQRVNGNGDRCQRKRLW